MEGPPCSFLMTCPIKKLHSNNLFRYVMKFYWSAFIYNIDTYVHQKLGDSHLDGVAVPICITFGVLLWYILTSY